jgi:hypothetical protein
MTITGGVARYTVRLTDAPGASPILPNTAYVIYMRPYQVFSAPGTGATMLAFMPNYVIVTTPDDIYRPTPYPTTPVLFPVENYITDQSVGVHWRMHERLGFELFIAERLSYYPTGGTLIEIPMGTREAVVAALEDVYTPLRIAYVAGEQHFHLRVDDLFPGTAYYVWARAIALDAYGMPTGPWSYWSNPVNMRTLDISPPPPPVIAPAPETTMNLFNRLNDTEYSATDPYALHILLTRIFSDFNRGLPREDGGNFVLYFRTADTSTPVEWQPFTFDSILSGDVPGVSQETQNLLASLVSEHGAINVVHGWFNWNGAWGDGYPNPMTGVRLALFNDIGIDIVAWDDGRAVTWSPSTEFQFAPREDGGNFVLYFRRRPSGGVPANIDARA